MTIVQYQFLNEIHGIHIGSGLRPRLVMVLRRQKFNEGHLCTVAELMRVESCKKYSCQKGRDLKTTFFLTEMNILNFCKQHK